MGAGPDSGVPTAPANLPTGQPDFMTPENIGQENMGTSPVPPGVQKNGGALRTILMGIVALAFVGGIGALGYFVIYPILFPVKSPVTKTPVNTAPAVTLAAHVSYLAKSSDATAEIKLNDTSYSAIATALQNESFNQLADGKYKEVRIFDAKGQVPFGKYLAGISQTAASAGAWFADDFTALLYYDAAGVWPIYVAKLGNGTTASAVMSGMKSMEGSLGLGNFFISSPGSFTSFKDGKVGTYSTRYNVASQAGAAFNYGVFGNYFVISTSYNGLKNALPLLGL